MRNYSWDFNLLVEAARDGARCPQTVPHGPIRAGAISGLIAEGKIRSDVYRHNYRVVTILDGPHRGKSTAPPPIAGLKPWRVNGVRVHRIGNHAGR